jgi:hypothetical protein
LVVGAFDAPPVEPGQVAPLQPRGPQMAIVRRSSAPHGFSVLLVPRWPPHLRVPADREEVILRGFWVMAQFASATGVSMRELAAEQVAARVQPKSVRP